MLFTGNGRCFEAVRDGEIHPEDESLREFAVRVGGYAIEDVLIEKHEQSQYAEGEQ